MKFPLLFAWRYLFAKRSVNVINLITGLSVFGLGVGAAAVILVLSVFNGFEQVINDMFGKFNPAVKVLPARGKTFLVDSLPLALIRGFPGVATSAFYLEETAFFEYGDSQAFGKLRGIDSSYTRVSGVANTVIEGEFATRAQGRPAAVLGLGLRNKLDVNVGSAFEPLRIYAAKRGQAGALDKPFRVRSVFPVGTFVIQKEYDEQYLFTDLRLAQELLGLPGRVSAVELSLTPNAKFDEVADGLQASLGDAYVVQDRLEQDADILRLMNIEKWLGYATFTLVLLLVSFNLTGGLYLIVLDKQHDVAILRTMGTSTARVRGIFLGVGLLLSSLGAVLGIVLACGLYYLQVNYGLVSVPDGMVVSAYPIELRWRDVALVTVTVLLIGLLASLPASGRAAQVEIAAEV